MRDKYKKYTEVGLKSAETRIPASKHVKEGNCTSDQQGT
jgi:hypothetical protein